ncbi:hypothetical protein AAMO2058_001726200 [Amorphochlora amoebiformis]
MGATCQRLSTEGLPRIRRRLDANEDVNSSFVDRPAGLYAGPPPSQATMKDDDTKDGSRPAGSPSARSGMGDLTADDLLRLLADTKSLAMHSSEVLQSHIGDLRKENNALRDKIDHLESKLSISEKNHEETKRQLRHAHKRVRKYHKSQALRDQATGSTKGKQKKRQTATVPRTSSESRRSSGTFPRSSDTVLNQESSRRRRPSADLLPMYTRLAKLGVPHAMESMARCYKDGYGVKSSSPPLTPSKWQQQNNNNNNISVYRSNSMSKIDQKMAGFRRNSSASKKDRDMAADLEIQARKLRLESRRMSAPNLFSNRLIPDQENPVEISPPVPAAHRPLHRHREMSVTAGKVTHWGSALMDKEAAGKWSESLNFDVSPVQTPENSAISRRFLEISRSFPLSPAGLSAADTTQGLDSSTDIGQGSIHVPGSPVDLQKYISEDPQDMKTPHLSVLNLMGGTTGESLESYCVTDNEASDASPRSPVRQLDFNDPH